MIDGSAAEGSFSGTAGEAVWPRKQVMQRLEDWQLQHNVDLALLKPAAYQLEAYVCGEGWSQPGPGSSVIFSARVGCRRGGSSSGASSGGGGCQQAAGASSAQVSACGLPSPLAAECGYGATGCAGWT